VESHKSPGCPPGPNHTQNRNKETHPKEGQELQLRPQPAHPDGQRSFPCSCVRLQIPQIVQNENGRCHGTHSGTSQEDFGPEGEGLDPVRASDSDEAKKNKNEKVSKTVVCQWEGAARIGEGADKGCDTNEKDGKTTYRHQVDSDEQGKP